METLSLFRHADAFKSFSAGQVFFKVGETGDSMYVVKEGEVEIMVGDNVVETAGPGAILGEMALIDARPRSATAIAKSDFRQGEHLNTTCRESVMRLRK
jgi:CRP-like cAMP-binding protein